MPFQTPDLGKSKPVRIVGLILILAVALAIAMRPAPATHVNAPAELAQAQRARCEWLMATWKDHPETMTPALKSEAGDVCKAAAVSKVKADADK